MAEAGLLVKDLPRSWAAANLTERRRLLLTVLDAAYLDARGSKPVVHIRPKAAFQAVLAESGKLAVAVSVVA